MKPAIVFLSLPTVLMFCFAVCAQSGRKGKIPSVPPQVVEPSPTPTPKAANAPALMAEKNETYRCTDDESLARVLDTDPAKEPIFTSKTVDTKAEISSRPRPSYTREARRANIQGNVVLEISLMANGRVGPIKVLRGLPWGLTANAIRAACRIEFKPAIKDGKPVSQTLNVEYAFRLSDPSILAP